MKLGIIDWGIGGVSLLKKIREKSDLDIIYFSDTGYLPYGKVETEELRARVSLVIQFLKNRNCDRIAVACNAASTVLPNDKNIFGVIEAALDLVNQMNLNSIGIVGGKRTIESEIYKKELEKKGINVKQEIAQPLSALIEKGDLHSKELIREIERIFTPLKNEFHILLACTHYPAITPQINAFLPNAVLIDPIERMCDKIMNDVQAYKGNNSTTWITSGNIQEMNHSIQLVYGIEPKQIEKNVL
jgi:glutamate racemase